MQAVVVDKPYEFVPPHRGRWAARLIQLLLRRYLRTRHGITAVQAHGTDLLRQSLDAGLGVLMAPNHCRPADPFVVGEMARRIDCQPHAMASWHLFAESRLQGWLMRMGGVFSVYREGMDRAAVNMAIDILSSGPRPLVIFPEGVVSRTNERLNPLMEGVSLIARGAARQRAKAGAPPVVVHPVALRYFYHGDVAAAVGPTLAEIEHRLSWQPQAHLALPQRIARLGLALLALKEIEYLGAPQSGPIGERLSRLIDHLLVPLEAQWLAGRREASVVARVKKLRTALLPDLVQGELDEAERQRRWRNLADMYLAQQLSFYPPDYLQPGAPPERLLETVERFEEDLTDVARPYPPLTAVVSIGPAIPVSPDRQRNGDDPLLATIESDLAVRIASTERPI
jgi:1-acyl-sn-glycerol-3-phosphate acyltransferase